MGAVIRLVNGSRATAREQRYVAKTTCETSRARAIQNHIFGVTSYDESRATAKEKRYVAKATCETSQARAIQNHIFGGNPYDGTYEITPTDYEQYLDTSGKVMRDDVTVHKVPYAETSNESGGFTVSILS